MVVASEHVYSSATINVHFYNLNTTHIQKKCPDYSDESSFQDHNIYVFVSPV